MADYITLHHGGGWKYQFHIPVELRPILGGMRAVVRYIKRMPRREALAMARQWAADDAAELAVYRAVPLEDRNAFASWGGLDAYQEYAEETEQHWLPDPDKPKQMKHVGDYALPPTFEQKRHNHLWFKANQIRTSVERSRPIVKAVSWDGLFAEWQRIKAPTKTRDHATTIRLLKAFLGECDCRQITPVEIAKFRDHLSSTTPRAMVLIRLTQIKAMFSAAACDPIGPFAGMVNPAVGVRVVGKNPPVKTGADKSFSPAQVRHILETAATNQFGKARHADILWMLRLMAFTGARPNEIAQLQGGDVCEVEGVKLIRFQNTDAVSGLRHPQKSIKTGESRVVPLHPSISDFFNHASEFAGNDFIFGSFIWNKDNGRAAYLISFFPKFLREDCGINEPTLRLTLYSFRHRFHDAMDEARIPEKIQKRLVGHGNDVHGRYGGKVLKMLQGYLYKIKPAG